MSTSPDDHAYSPIAVGGVGGSGTRAVALVLRGLGVDVGPDLNRSLDNLWFTLLFVRPRWLRRQLASGDGDLARGMRVLGDAMRGELRPRPADAAYIAAATADVALHGHNHLGEGRGRWALERARSLLSAGRRRRPQPAGWGWKEPATYLVLDGVRRGMPRARYVHVIRHGLDMAFSRNQQHVASFGPLYGVSAGANPSPRDALKFWLEANGRTLQSARHRFGDDFLVVRFEDLCADPRSGIERLAAFLGISAAPSTLDSVAAAIRLPASSGMYRREDLSVLDRADVERVRTDFGFDVLPAGRSFAFPVRATPVSPLRVSVAMCTYNGARYLREQLESVAAATRRPDELVVCDDGSTDETLEIVAAFGEAAPFQVRVMPAGPSRLGPGRNFGRAIEACTGDVIALSDQDDVWLPDRLDRIEAAFDTRPSLAMLFTDADLIDDRSRALQRRLWEALGITPGMHRRFTRGPAAERVRMLCEGNLMTGATLALRASFRDLVLPIPPGWIHDAWMGLLVSAVAEVEMLPERTIQYRLHGGQQVGIGVASLTRTQHFVRRAQLVRRMTKRERPAFEEVARGLREARVRLTERADRYAVGRDVLAVLEQKSAHFAARAAMADGARWPLIREELRAGRYHRYSNGWPSVAKDLLLLDRFGASP